VKPGQWEVGVAKVSHFVEVLKAMYSREELSTKIEV